jgi:predicted methyltransferase
MYDKATQTELSRFAGVEPGSVVLDVFPGKGDWTRLFSDLVGPEGRVYSFVPAEVAHFESDPVGQMRTLAREPGRENVQVISADVADPPIPPHSLDVVWVHLFYHDLHTALIQTHGATAARFNQAVFDRLRPGGLYVIVDHAAAAGTGASQAQALHRIDPAAARDEVEAAGFGLAAEADLLANPGDPHDVRVFDPAIKGETDRFAYRFVRT